VDNNGLVSFNEAKAVLAQPPFSFNEEKVTRYQFLTIFQYDYCYNWCCNLSSRI